MQNKPECKYKTIPFDYIAHKSKKATLFFHENLYFWLPNTRIEIDLEEKIVSYEDWIDIKYLDENQKPLIKFNTKTIENIIYSYEQLHNKVMKSLKHITKNEINLPNYDQDNELEVYNMYIQDDKEHLVACISYFGNNKRNYDTIEIPIKQLNMTDYELSQVNKTTDDEYENYMRLKKKFEPQSLK